MKVFLALALALVACTDRRPPAAQPTAIERCTLIRNVRVFDGANVTEHGSVVVRGGVIAEVGVTAACRDVVDGTGRTLLPGLIDSHVHVWDETQLQAGMRFGVTTMLDMMTDWQAAARLKASASTRTELSDLRSAGNPVTARGGHGTEYGLRLATLGSAKDADAFVAARVKEGSDYLKIIYTPDLPMFHSIDRDELRASVEAAHHHQRIAVVHIDTEREATDALEAGADGLAHLFYDRGAGAAFVTLARDRKVFIVPTLSVLTTLTGKPHGATLAKDPVLAARLSSREIAALERTYPVTMPPDEAGIVRSVRALHAAGVPLLAGTDSSNPGTSSGVSMHGELELLVAAGLSPTEALAAATAAPARAFGLGDRGRIARGARADLLLVEGNPTTDIRATRRIVAVWKAGMRLADRFFETPESAPEAPPAAEPVAQPAPGLISDFDDEAMPSRFGTGWTQTTDAIIGGTSVVTLGRSKNAKGFALAVRGTVAAGPSPWSGVMFNPGDKLWTPVDLSSGTSLVFSARGDGRRYGVLLFTKRGGRIGARQLFVAGKGWTQHRLVLSDFAGTDARDVVGIAFVAGPDPGSYGFELDDVELR